MTIDVEAGVKWFEDLAADPAHGYNQAARDGGVDYDCSSAVYMACIKMGFPWTLPSFSTRTMKGRLEANGWIWHEGTDGVGRGDILWMPGHTAMATSGVRMGEACIDENGNIYGGRPGDQTGNEIRVANINIYNWKGYWRYEMNVEDIWNFEINGVKARDRLYGMDAIQLPHIINALDSTEDPSGRGMRFTTHDHVKYLAAAIQELLETNKKILERLDTLLENK